jgi:hypothetical protein
MTRLSTLSGFALAVVLFANAGVLADTVVLKDGSQLEGTVISETADQITLLVKMGTMRGSVALSRADIVTLTRAALPADTVPVSARKLADAAETQRDPAKAALAWLVVAGFYERNPGYGSHAKACYEKALLCDPENVFARERLGFVKMDGVWKRPLPPVAAAAGEEGLVIRKAAPADDAAAKLQKDAALIRELLDDQAARQQRQRDLLAQANAVPAVPVWNPENSFVYRYGYGYGCNPTYVWTRDGLVVYPSGVVTNSAYDSYSSGWGGWSGNTFRDYDYGSSYNSGVSLGFRGKIGSVRVSGSINNGFGFGRTRW